MFRRAGMALSLLVLVLVAGLAGVSQLKFSSFLSESINERLEIVVATSARDFSSAIDLGLSLDEIANGPAILDRGREHDPNIESVYVIDLDGEILHLAGAVPRDIDTRILNDLDLAIRGVTGPEWGSESDESLWSGSLIRGSFGRPVGAIVVEYPTTEMREQTRSMVGRLALNGVVVAAGMILLGTLVFGVFRNRLLGSATTNNPVESAVSQTDADPAQSVERTSRLLALSVSGLLVTGVAVFGVLIVREFNDALAPELERRAALIGETMTDDVERAVKVGIPIDELVGVSEYFTVFLDQFTELDYLAIEGAQGTPLYFAGAADSQGTTLVTADESTEHTFGLRAADADIGSVVVGVDSGFVQSRLQDLAIDVLVILIVVLVIAFEATLVLSRRIATANLSTPSSPSAPSVTAGSASDIRIVLFLFVVGEELSKSFLPLLIQSAHNPLPGLDTEIAVSLPIVAYLLTIATTSPFAGRLINRFGNKGMFAMGVVPAALSHLGMVFADDVLEIVALRSLTGIGYALVTISAMEYLLERIANEGRAKTIGAFVTVIIGGTFSGTALGGILADRLGYDDVFIISFVMVLLAGVLGLAVMKTEPTRDRSRTESFRISEVALVLRHPSLMRLMAGVTVPMNVLMAAFLWYLVPLSMASVGSSASTIARTLMVYYLVILLGGPVATRLAEGRIESWILVGVGSVGAGLALLIPAISLSDLTVAFAVLLVGVGHTVVRGPQVVMALDIADTEFPDGGRGPILAAMRSLERLGSLAGLLIVAMLASWFSLTAAIGAIGATAALAGFAFLVTGPAVTAKEPANA